MFINISERMCMTYKMYTYIHTWFLSEMVTGHMVILVWGDAQLISASCLQRTDQDDPWRLTEGQRVAPGKNHYGIYIYIGMMDSLQGSSRLDLWFMSCIFHHFSPDFFGFLRCLNMFSHVLRLPKPILSMALGGDGDERLSRAKRGVSARGVDLFAA